MYEQTSHSLLNRVLDNLDADSTGTDQRSLHTRLGANFYAIHTLFQRLYGERSDTEHHLTALVQVLVNRYNERRAELRDLDAQREARHDWFLSENWVGMALYLSGFSGNLKGLRQRLPYLQELGVNLVHILPILECPKGASDGGYAVSDFKAIDSRAGTLDELRELADTLRQREMLTVLDVVLNHTSDEHPWAKAARAGDPVHRDYYHIFDDRTIPDRFEETMPEVFPETAPGNFTYDDAMGKWVMTVFNHYQWDLNYRNPAVFIEMVDVILFWANQGADIVRLDAVAFLWKKLGTTCQNEREAHLILQLMKDCCQVSAPGVLFIAEAIVAPVEITKYFGEDAVIAKECEIAYNATFMALMWDAIATRNARLLNQGIRSLPDKLDQATWLNYARCHDDIGLGFDDRDVAAVGYEPRAHRRFLLDYFTGKFPGSPARGQPFGQNDKTGDARISGSLASLVGLESALDDDDETAIQAGIERILLLHGLIIAFGGIPLLYYGDEIGTLNDERFRDDITRAFDNRWISRPTYDWDVAERRHQHGSVEERIFSGLKRMIGVRKTLGAFADYNNRELIPVGNPHLFVFTRTSPATSDDSVLIVANFDETQQRLDMADLGNRGRFDLGKLVDTISGESVPVEDGGLRVPARGILWLQAVP